MAIHLKSALLVGAATLSMLLPQSKTSSLKDIASPHLGVYECEWAKLGERDMLEEFSDLRLELRSDGEFTLFYQKKEGKRRQLQGKYDYDRERGVLTLRGGGLTREFPLSEGKLTVRLPVGKETLILRFEQK